MPEQFRTPKWSGPSPGELYAARDAEQKKEKANIFRDASFLAILMLIYNFLNRVNARLFWIGTYMVFSGKITLDAATAQAYLLEQKEELISSTTFKMTGSVLIVVVSSIGIFLIGQFIMKVRLTDILKPYRGFALDGAKFFPAALSLNLLSGVIVTVIVSKLGEQGITVPGSDFSMHSPTKYELLIQFVYVCLIGPICEEFIYRGLVIKLLSPYGKGIAVVFSALTFGLMHANIEQAVPAVMGGLVYALVAVRYNSIAPTIVIHVLNNICASVSDYGDALGWSNTDLINRIIDITTLFLGFYGIIVLFTALIAEVHESEPKSSLSTEKRFGAVFTNVFVIIYLVYLFWELVEKIIQAN